MGMGGGPVDPHATGSCVRCGGQGCADCGQPRDDPEYQHPAAMDDPASFDHPTLDRAAIEPRFHELPRSIQRIEKCGLCRQPFTVMTELHHRSHCCTGCMLRTLRPYDYVVKADA